MPQYDEIEIEDMTYDPETCTYSYPCPCGDRFKVSLEDLWDGEDIADCNSCTLYIQVIYEKENLPPLPDHDDSDDDDDGNKCNESVQKEADKNEDEMKQEDSTETTPKEKDDVTLAMGDLSLNNACMGNEQKESGTPAAAAS
ncbi:CSL zinc finger domain containing protein [Nitzschia inconspicua]|uniref:CSL zinc finger domain containing protein n=1 Tax=Nitzschia inconspicua TaxID=303405 RepID=A0A9K3LFK0_9STRA|nr:CSL zinc finger domain containing protein [Nitzschia inconspicua]